MRSDFPKLLVECYRAGANRNPGHGPPVRNDDVVKVRRSHIRVDEDGEISQRYDIPSSTGMKQKGNHGKKFFGENLAPLARFLEKQVGRSWNKVYSEIKEFCPTTGAVNNHIYMHLWGYVEKDVVMVKGKPYHSVNNEPLVSVKGRAYMYVNPLTGILCKAPVKDGYKFPSEDHIRSEFLVAHKDHGVWVAKMDAVSGNKQWFKLLDNPEGWNEMTESRLFHFLNKKGFPSSVDRYRTLHFFTKAHPKCAVGGMKAEFPPERF